MSFAVKLLLACCLPATLAHAQVGGPPVAWPDVSISQRDYQGNIQATDRLYASMSQVHPVVEFPAYPSVSAVAYLRGSTISIEFKSRNDNPFPLWGTLTWQNARLACPTNLATIEYLPLSINAAPEVVYLGAFGGEQQFELTISNVPNHVAVGQLELQYDLPLTDGVIAGNNGTNGSYVGWERVCLLDASPTGLQSVPWVDFLEFSCRWAFGSVGQAQTMRELTKGLNKSNRCPDNRTSYSPFRVAEYYVGGALPSLWLTGFLESISSQMPTELDCREYAAILLLANESQGASSTFRWLERWDAVQQLVPGPFYTWPMCPAGTDDTVSGNRQEDLGFYQSYGFNFHCVVGWGGQRYDSAASYLWNPFAQVWENPAFDWPEPVHWQNPVGVYNFGLVYGLTPATFPFDYNQFLSWHYKDATAPVYIN